jgi:hypothetical protein
MLKRYSAVFLSGAFVGVIVVLVSRAGAGGVPATAALRYAGKFEDAKGEPITGQHAVQINFWDSEMPSNSAPLCFTRSQRMALDEGRFSIALPDKCADAIRDHADVWSEVLLDGVSMGTTKLGAVPYALEAEHALRADAASGTLQTTIDSLSRKTRIVSAVDQRNGCPPAGEVGTPLLTINFTLSKETAVQITGNMIRLFAGRADLELMVDNVSRFEAITNTSAKDWTTAHVEWTGTLSEGDHSAWFQGRPGYPDAADLWGCGPGYGTLAALLFE